MWVPDFGYILAEKVGPVISDLMAPAKVLPVCTLAPQNEIRQDTTLIRDMRDLLCRASTLAANGRSVIEGIGVVVIELS